MTLSALPLGAIASVQGLKFLISLAFGLVAGVPSLLYFRKAHPIERALTDFFATLCVTAIYIVCTEFLLDGKIELYTLLAYAIGLCALPATYLLIKHRKRKKR